MLWVSKDEFKPKPGLILLWAITSANHISDQSLIALRVGIFIQTSAWFDFGVGDNSCNRSLVPSSETRSPYV
jgi:hypothetical protein